MEKRTIGSFIAVLRKANGMTQKELGDILMVSDKTVSRWERDENTPDITLLPIIADTFDITVDELLRGTRKSKTIEDAGSEEKGRRKSEKQFQYMLEQKQKRYKNVCVVLISICILAMLFMVLFPSFWFVGLVCYAGVFVAQYICNTNYKIKIEEDEEQERKEALEKYNADIQEKTMIGMAVAVGLPIGIMFVGAALPPR